MKKIAENIKTLRIAKGIEKKTMASKLQISYAGYHKIENGQVDIPASKIVKICEIFSVRSNELFDAS